MSFGKTSENEVFTYHEIRLKKTATKKLLGITIDEQTYTKVSSLPSYQFNRKWSCETFSSVDNSVIVLLFGNLVT